MNAQETWNVLRKHGLKALKIAIGSCFAIVVANFLHIDNPNSAGTITLLTLLTTKWDTFHLSIQRLISVFMTIVIAFLLFTFLPSKIIAYMILLFVMVVMLDILKWQGTLSVNSVVGAHFLLYDSYDYVFFCNEVLLVVIGILIAIVLNLFNSNYAHHKHIIRCMRNSEARLQIILGELAAYLNHKTPDGDVKAYISETQVRIRSYMNEAQEYQDNTFHSHPQYYIDYFDMRLKQCNVLANLYREILRIGSLPKQAKIVADYMEYISLFVVEFNYPESQTQRLDEIFAEMEREPLPKSRPEFENRALLFHILKDLEDFLIIKDTFIKNLDSEQRAIYWRREVENPDWKGKEHAEKAVASE